jgi:hypothetical protein
LKALRVAPAEADRQKALDALDNATRKLRDRSR